MSRDPPLMDSWNFGEGGAREAMAFVLHVFEGCFHIWRYWRDPAEHSCRPSPRAQEPSGDRR